jgi:ketosteroid isomerase-like protein
MDHESAVVAAVRSRMTSFEAAERARDADALLAHFADAPGFRFFNDGHAVTYAQLAEMIRSTFPTLRALEGGFRDLQVLVLGPEHALASATFSEAVTGWDGSTVKARGAASWLWRRMSGEWRIVYGQVDHRPDP